MNDQQWREKVIRIFERRNRYQFGQPAHTCSLVSVSGCTDTCIQMIVMLVKELNVSLNEVRRRSGAPALQPLNSDEALRALHSFGLPYERQNDLRAMELLNIAQNRGPVIVCELYWAHPQWKGYQYAGRELHGTAINSRGRRVKVGFADPEKRAGLTQWTFRDGHAVLLGAEMRKDRRRYGIIRDPNHNSPSRPERPAYDLISIPQLNRMVDSFATKYGYRVALVPTRDIRR